MSKELLGPDKWFQTFNTEEALGKYVLESHPLLPDPPFPQEESECMPLWQEFTLVYKEKLEVDKLAQCHYAKVNL